ncbi:hypothetical protein [Streptomyces flaveolus]|uniref:hypothetical protein n=1 Tax=Streptomyces flaveolus TaxID=67297 RepID=UPI00380B77A9
MAYGVLEALREAGPGAADLVFTDSLPVAAEKSRPAPRLDSGPTYLVTGGLSDLAAVAARHLATGTPPTCPWSLAAVA